MCFNFIKHTHAHTYEYEEEITMVREAGEYRWRGMGAESDRVKTSQTGDSNTYI